MDGIQKQIYDALIYMANNVRYGKYGNGSDILDNVDAFLEDLEENVTSIVD